MESTRTTGTSGNAGGSHPYSTNQFFTDDQGSTYEIYTDPSNGTQFPVMIATAESSQNRYGTRGYGQLGAGGYSSAPPPPAPAPAPAGGGGGGMAPAPAASGGYAAPAAAPAPTYAPGPTYANGQASRIPVAPAPPPTTTGFARSPWSVSMGQAIGSFDPKASPPSFSLPQPLPNQPSRPPAMTIDEFMALRESLGR